MPTAIVAQKETFSILPPAVVELFSGLCLEQQLGEAVGLHTSDEEGWVYTAFLSFGEILALHKSCMAFLLWSHTDSVRNLQRNPRSNLVFAHTGGVGDIRLRVHQVHSPLSPLAAFVGNVEQYTFRAAPYATVSKGLSFQLHDPSTAIARWREQLTILRNCNPENGDL